MSIARNKRLQKIIK